MKNTQWIAQWPIQSAAPILRGSFVLKKFPPIIKCRVAGLGFYELYLNGRRVGDARLDPPFSSYDVRTFFREYQVDEYLVCGTNLCEIHLGKGWYSGKFADVWGFEFARYRSFPKAALRIFSGRRTLFVTNTAWQAASGPVLEDSPRTGETYDARIRTPLQWGPVKVVTPPGGKLTLVTAPPVICLASKEPVASHREEDGGIVFDFGSNGTGTVELAVKGAAGSMVTLLYGELCGEDGRFTQKNIDWYVNNGDFQTDHYILQGDPESEHWTPAFSYHGFRYLKALIPGNVELQSIRMIPLRSGFDENGSFQCGSERFSSLLAAIYRSLSSNFVGFPSDCPHREKNGWTADAHLAAESMLCWFDAAESYREYVDTIFDFQRPSGQLPGMVPGGGFGGHWEFGPVWESAPLLLAYYCYWYCGSDRIIREHYRELCRYMAYCKGQEVHGLLDMGPGEWILPPDAEPASALVIDNAYYFRNCCMMAEFAEHLGKHTDALKYHQWANTLKQRIKALPLSSASELGCLLDCGLGSRSDAERLNQMIIDANWTAQCGIVGAKAIPRALAAAGFMDTSFKMFVQTSFPGWQWMLDHGATTLWENWIGNQSQNHPMLGDAAAWAVKYLVGITPVLPGFKKIRMAPNYPEDLPEFGWRKRTPSGEITCSWCREKSDSVSVNISIPEAVVAEFVYPDGTIKLIDVGEHCIKISL